MAHYFLGGPDHQQTLSERYWSSFSRSPMFSWFSISVLMPRIQDWASSADSATRSRLPRRPRKTSVKHRSAGNSSARLRSTSDWCPSRMASTSLTETGQEDRELVSVTPSSPSSPSSLCSPCLLHELSCHYRSCHPHLIVSCSLHLVLTPFSPAAHPLTSPSLVPH